MRKNLSMVALAAIVCTSGLVTFTAIQSATAQSSTGPLTRMSNTVDELQSQLTALERSNEDQKLQLKVLVTENEKLHSNFALLNLQVEAFQSRIDFLQLGVARANDNITHVELQITELRALLQDELLDLKSRLAQSEQQLVSNSNKTSPEEIQQLSGLVDKMLAQITSLESRVTALENSNGQSMHDGANDGTNNGSTSNGSGSGPIKEDRDSDGYSAAEGDCNENNADINPAKTEVANGLDDNCNGLVDEGTTPFFQTLILNTIDGTGSLTDSLEYSASAKYSDDSVVDVTNEANWQGDGTATSNGSGKFLCVGPGTGQIKATYKETAVTASYSCSLL